MTDITFTHNQSEFPEVEDDEYACDQHPEFHIQVAAKFEGDRYPTYIVHEKVPSGESFTIAELYQARTLPMAQLFIATLIKERENG